MKAVRLAQLGALMLVTLVSFVDPARGQVADHLKCYKARDYSLKLSGIADLVTPQFGLDTGCTVSKAMLFCVPASKTNVAATNKATGLPIVPSSFSTAPQAGDQICYKVKCPTPTTPIPQQSITDQFGNRTLSRFKASLVCVPAVKGTAYCGDGTIDPGEECEPSDLGGESCVSLGFRPGTLACAPGCTFDTSGCPLFPAPGSCGNGTIEGGETCDGPDLGGATCASVGFASGGVLGCDVF